MLSIICISLSLKQDNSGLTAVTQADWIMSLDFSSPGLAIQNALSEDSDQTARMHRLT